MSSKPVHCSWSIRRAAPSMPVSWPSSSKMLRTSQLVVVLPALPVTPTTANFSEGLQEGVGNVDHRQCVSRTTQVGLGCRARTAPHAHHRQLLQQAADQTNAYLSIVKDSLKVRSRRRSHRHRLGAYADMFVIAGVHECKLRTS